MAAAKKDEVNPGANASGTKHHCRSSRCGKFIRLQALLPALSHLRQAAGSELTPSTSARISDQPETKDLVTSDDLIGE